jgi:excisionase family DNA binding protein
MSTKDDLKTKGPRRNPTLDYSLLSEALQEGKLFLLGPENEKYDIPSPLAKILQEAMAELYRGKTVEVVTSNLQVTTQDAADYLGMSRPTFVQLLNDGKLPYTQAGDGKHRRIRISDLVDYQQQEKLKRDAAFTEFLRLGQEMQADPNYVEPPMDEIIRIIKEIRKENVGRERAKGNS